MLSRLETSAWRGAWTDPAKRQTPDVVNIFHSMSSLHHVINSLSGSLPYMAPEIHIGEPYSREADLWSLGLYLYKRREEIDIYFFYIQDAYSLNSVP